MPLEIPRTKARLQPYIRLYASDYDGTQDVSVSLSQFTNPFAAVQKIEIANDRTVEFWRELNADTEGRIQETYPGLPTFGLTLSRVVLYKANLLESFGITNSHGMDLIEQTRPFDIVIHLLEPDTSSSAKPGSSKSLAIGYWGCWFSSNPIHFDITATDLKIVQEVKVVAAGLISFKST